MAAYPCLAFILDALIPTVHALCTQGSDSLSHRQRTQLALLESPLPDGACLYQGYLHVLDFVGSMTDNPDLRGLLSRLCGLYELHCATYGLAASALPDEWGTDPIAANDDGPSAA